MLYVDIPSREEFLALTDVRSDACVSIYLETSPLRQEQEASKIQFGNAIKTALQLLTERNFDKRRLALIEEELYAILEDQTFWLFHAYSLAVLATPDRVVTYRLANHLSYHVEVADRFYLKPLLRSLLFPHSAYALAVSENEVRLVEFFGDAAPAEVHLPNMPKDATSAVGKASLTSRMTHGRVHGNEGRKIHLAQYSRKIDQALRPLLLAHDFPLILISTDPLASIYRATNTLPNLLDETISTNPEHINISDLVALARPVLEKHYQQQIEGLKDQFELRAGERRVTYDLSDAARAATMGAIALLLVDIESVVCGTIDDNGIITFAKEGDQITYGVVDEIVKRALATGAKVLAVRKEDLPKAAPGELAAILRYAM